MSQVHCKLHFRVRVYSCRSDGVSRRMSRLETVSRHGSVSTLVYLVLALSRVSMSHHVSCLMTVSLSGIAKCLFCIETLAFLTESRPLEMVVTSPATAVAKYCDECVCLSVCPTGYLRNPTSDFYRIFCAHCPCPWLGPRPAR